MLFKLSNVGVVILAAGKGTRLNHPTLPKVLAPVGNRPLLDYTVSTLYEAGFVRDQIRVVVGYRQEAVKNFLGTRVNYAVQEELIGTAHAAYTGMIALPLHIRHVLVMGGDDSAFYKKETLLKLIYSHKENGNILTLLSAKVKDPGALGRVLRSSDGSIKIIEKEYLTPEQNSINEISTGTFVLNRVWFEAIFPIMPKLEKLGEYGLPTAMEIARKYDQPYKVVLLENPDEWFGVNTPEELKEADLRKRGQTIQV